MPFPFFLVSGPHVGPMQTACPRNGLTEEPVGHAVRDPVNSVPKPGASCIRTPKHTEVRIGHAGGGGGASAPTVTGKFTRPQTPPPPHPVHRRPPGPPQHTPPRCHHRIAGGGGAGGGPESHCTTGPPPSGHRGRPRKRPRRPRSGTPFWIAPPPGPRRSLRPLGTLCPLRGLVTPRLISEADRTASPRRHRGFERVRRAAKTRPWATAIDELEGGGDTPPSLQDAQPMPSRCLPEGRCQLQWHL